MKPGISKTLPLLFILILVSACGGSTPVPLPTVTPGPVFTPTQTALPPTSTPTSTPSLILPARRGTPYPQPVEVISPENAARVSLLALWGKGDINDIAISPGWPVSFSPDGSRLATLSDGTVTIWDTASGLPMRVFNGEKSAAISPDWSLLAISTGPEDRPTIQLWDMTSGQILRELSFDNYGRVYPQLFSPDGKILLLSEWGSSNVLLLWDTAGGSLLHVLQGDKPFASYLVAFSPEGKTLVTTDYYMRNWRILPGVDLPSGDVQFWDVASGAKLGSLHLGESEVYSLVFSPDGDTLAVLSLQNLTLWNWGSGTLLQTLDPGMIAERVAFSPDGKVLAFGGREWGDISLWDISTGAHLARLGHNNLEITGLVFSPDGTRLASSMDDALLIWGVRP